MAGGCERFVHETATRIAAMPGFAVDVFANRWENADPCIRYRRVPMVRFPKFIKPWAFVRAAQRMIGRGGYDVVHAHLRNDFAHITTVHPAPHRFWLADVLNKRRPSLHDRTMIAMERRMIATASGRVFHPVSPMLLGIWRSEYGDLPGCWEVQCPGVDADRFAPNPGSRAAMRRQLGIGEGEFVLLFVGMNFEVKGLLPTIKALSRCARRDPLFQPRLLVVGKGDRQRYEEVARSLGVPHLVQFVGVETARLSDHFAASDAFVMPSTFETYCMAVQEAMASGLPAIVTRRMGVAFLVEQAQAGAVLSDAGDDAGFDRAIDALRHGKDRSDAGHRARAAAIELSWDSVVRRIADEYRRSAANSRPGIL
jgi:UDP-glucose:(heptosyl)LPS alpha-1,3-glucosyltransferase